MAGLLESTSCCRPCMPPLRSQAGKVDRPLTAGAATTKAASMAVHSCSQMLHCTPRRPTGASNISTQRARATAPCRLLCFCSSDPGSRGAADSHQQSREPLQVLWQSHTARVAAFTGTYILAVGMAVLIAPQTVFGLLFDTRLIHQAWIRVLGVLAAVFGIYWLSCSAGEATGHGLPAFYVGTVIGRLLLAAAFASLSRQLGPGLLLLGLLNAAGALSTALALCRQQQA